MTFEKAWVALAFCERRIRSSCSRRREQLTYQLLERVRLRKLKCKASGEDGAVAHQEGEGAVAGRARVSFVLATLSNLGSLDSISGKG